MNLELRILNYELVKVIKMFKKSFAALMALVLAIFVTGCGGGNDTKKAAEDVPQYSADKAVQGYAEMYAFGVTNNMKEAGLTEVDVKEVSDKIVGEMVAAFAEFPLSDENIANMTGVYVDKLDKAMGIKTTLKKDDPEAPVVTLSVKTVNEKGVSEVAASNPDLLALAGALGELQGEGMSLEDLKNNENFQKSAMECITKFIGEMPLNPETTMDVVCEKVKGNDGKLYWAPTDAAAVAAFVQPQ